MSKRGIEDLGGGNNNQEQQPPGGGPSKYRRVAPKQEYETTYEAQQQNLQLQQEASNFSVIRQPVTPSIFPDKLSPIHNNFQPVLSSPFPALNRIQPVNNQAFSNQNNVQGQVKFETALEFLDQVKHQFALKPEVYKQFLKIMKDFKLHEIDTPGVIGRVSELFKGHNHLIIGFNHFLPEGYKIELSDLPVSGITSPISNRSHSVLPSSNSFNHSLLSNNPPTPSSSQMSNQNSLNQSNSNNLILHTLHNPSDSPSSQVPQISHQPPSIMNPAPPSITSNNPLSSNSSIPPSSSLISALNSNSNMSSNPNVISSLGVPSGILQSNVNQSLLNNSNIHPSITQSASSLSSLDSNLQNAILTPSQGSNSSSSLLPNSLGAAVPGILSANELLNANASSNNINTPSSCLSQPSSPLSTPSLANSSPNNNSMQTSPSTPSLRKQPELDQARNYVKKIKMRFETQPEIYKSFLRILHTYHEEHHTIKDVYDQVANLFHSHLDLLSEFKQFLPDTTSNDSPPSRPRRIKSGKRKSGGMSGDSPQRSSNVNEYNFFDSAKLQLRDDPHLYTEFLKVLNLFNEEILSKSELFTLTKDLFSEYPELFSEFRQFCDFSEEELQNENNRPSSNQVNNTNQMVNANTHQIHQLHVLNNHSNLNNHSSSIANNSVFDSPPSIHSSSYSHSSSASASASSTLSALGNHQFNHHTPATSSIPSIHSQYNSAPQQLASHPPSSNQQSLPSNSQLQQQLQQQQHLQELGTCKRYGPSYRMYNNLSNEAQVCSGRSKEEEEVLNDTWVSVPVGSEDGFKASRKNQYEEILFKCEDDRYELDMVIEVNSSTIMALTPVIKQIQDSTTEQLKSFKLEDGLDILHLRAIERIYGEKGSLVLQGINKNPVVAVPIVLKRLQQKDQEWRIARNQWNNIWKEVNEKNYFKSLDYQSMYFKQKEKKTLNPRELLAEIKKDKFQTSEGNHIFQFRMDYPNIFKDIEDLIEFQANRMNLTHQDSEKLKSFVHDFIKQFFKLSQQANLHQSHTNPSQPPTQSSTSLFFGNNSFYVFFRFYQMLYSRLAEAIQMSFTVFQEQQQKSNTNQQQSTTPNNSISLYSYPSILASDSNNKLKQKFKSPYEIYEFYLKDLLHPLISSDVDPVKYEDECRDLFGISSYILFTMDRLLQALVKQIQSIFLEEISVKLISLHSYEASRSKDYLESIYYSNAYSLINEESCFKFKFILSENGGEFTIQLIDSSAQQPAIMELSMPKEPVITMSATSNSNTSSSSTSLNSMNISNISNPNNKPTKSLTSSNTEPSTSSVISSNSIPSSSVPNTSNQSSQSNQVPDGQQETIDVRKHNVFLLRNQASSMRNSGRNANKRVIANSGLECKICMSTFRLFYVEETEDYFYRVGQLSRARNSRYPAKRKERLIKWINSRLSI